MLHAYQAVREDQVRPPGVLLPWLLLLLLQPGRSTPTSMQGVPCKLHARACMHACMPAAAGGATLPRTARCQAVATRGAKE